MASNSLDTTLTAISSITRKYFFKELVDEITTSNPLLMKLKGRMETVDGGDDIRVPVEIAYTTNAMWYSGDETLSVSGNDQFFALIFSWKQHNVAITISELDRLKNAGSSKVVDVVKSKSISGARTFLSTSATYGGISQSTESWLQAKMDTSTTTLSLSALQTRYEAASEPPIKPNFATTTETMFNAYHALLTPIQRFTDSKTADAGYANLLFRGCPVVEDSYCPSGYWIFWNLDYVNLYSHSQRTFPGELVDFQKPINQDVAVAHLRWAGEFICKAPRFQGAFTALAA